jgi:hypothetical protein
MDHELGVDGALWSGTETTLTSGRLCLLLITEAAERIT